MYWYPLDTPCLQISVVYTLEIEEKVAAMQNEKQQNPQKNLQKSGQETLQADVKRQADVATGTPDTQNDEEGILSMNADEEQNPELAALIREGQKIIRRLQVMNDAIEGEVVSEKLFKLEKLLHEIFTRVKEHPEEMPQMQKFMNYYLPTTLKLVEAYAEFDKVSEPGEEIISAKVEIEKTLDTINQAFAELLNKLFRASVFDVTTDAQVLQTMLAKEGLTKDGLTKGE